MSSSLGKDDAMPDGRRPEYPTFVTQEGPEIDRAYRDHQGTARPTAGDVRHTAYRRLVEGWDHAEILKDIAAPGTGRPGPGPTDPGRPTVIQRPTRDAVRAIRGLFAPKPGWFDYFLAAYPLDTFHAIIDEHLKRGDTHVLIGLQSNGYRHLRGFNFWSDPTPVIDRVKIIRAAGLIPTWVLHDDLAASARVEYRAEVYADHWDEVADAIRPWVDIVIPAFEWNDHLRPADQDRLLRHLAALFPDAYRLVTFTDDRWAGAAAAQSSHPDGPLPASWRGGEYGFWVAMRGVVHGLAFQAGLDQIDSDKGRYRVLRGRLAELVLRLNGTRQPDFPDAERDFDQKFGGVPAGDFDVHLWEGGAEWMFQGSRGPAWGDLAGAAALTVPGVIGAGDGWKP